MAYRRVKSHRRKNGQRVKSYRRKTPKNHMKKTIDPVVRENTRVNVLKSHHISTRKYARYSERKED